MTNYAITFIVDKESGKTDGKLRMRIRWRGNKVDLNLGYRVEIAKWEPESQRCKVNTSHGKKKITAYEINRAITRYEEAAVEAFRKLPDNPEPAQYRDYLKELLGREVNNSGELFPAVFCRYISEVAPVRGLSESSANCYTSVAQMVANEYPSLSIRTMATAKWQEDFVTRRVAKGIKNRTIRDELSKIKIFLRWCERKDLVKLEETDVRLKVIPKDIVWLSWEELTRLSAYNPPKDIDSRKQRSQTIARDMFLLSSYTGLRHSDLKALRHSDIYDGCIHLVTVKTGKPIIIEINKHAQAVLDRWKEKGRGERLFPSLNHTAVSMALRDIFKNIGLDAPIKATYYIGGQRVEEMRPKYELLTLHCGRRTFICNAIEMGISPQVIMQWTGHKSYVSMKPYIAVSDNARATAMKMFDDK